MFSGIVETTGVVKELTTNQDCLHVCIAPNQPLTDLKIGDSIAVNGVCLTITHYTSSVFHITLVPETMRLTNLAQLLPDHLVNLERACRLSDRIGGHYVQGHVDGTGEIIDIQPDGPKLRQLDITALNIKIAIPEMLAKYIIKKGFIAVDGMSLTITAITSQWFAVTLIPHTQHVTIAKTYRLGSYVNIEIDSIARYIEKFCRELI